VTEHMRPHCGMRYPPRPGLVPEHSAALGNSASCPCPGSGQNPRNPETDRRPLWKDLPHDEREATRDD
jgi:hypothetical protein